MKKIVIALAVVLNCSFAVAQTEFDALKMIQTDINGTARYMGMAGAFGALGGDASAVKDNPAGIGIYRTSELVGTLNMFMQNTSANWNGTKGFDDLYKVGANNFSYVIASPTWRNESGNTGLLNSNFSFAYNRLKNFNRSLNIKGGAAGSSMTDYMGYFTGNLTDAQLRYTDNYEPFDNVNVPWLSVLAFEGNLMQENISSGRSTWSSILGSTEKSTPAYKLTERGHLDEYSVGWAGNFSNMFYFGATLNYQALNYLSFSSYNEDFEGGGGMTMNDSIYSKGSGFNFKIGAIVAPTDFLRFGLSLHTPTVYTLNENYYSKLTFDTDISGSIRTPGSTSSFQLQSPMQLNASAAFILGQKGIVSAEYNFSNYTGTRLRGINGDSFDDENEGMREMLNDVRTIKVGGEYKLTNNFAVRAGYANTNNGTKPNAAKLMRYNTTRTDTEYFLHNRTDYLTAGFGYRESGWFIDFAYMNKIVDETFYPYNSNNLTNKVTPAEVITTNNNVVITLGLRF
jgi:hypothetical protein